MEDAQIIDLYWQRSEQAIAETSCKYGSYCHAISYNILRVREDAEECVSDTYQWAWTSIPPERPGRLKTWLGVVTRNLSIDLWHKNRAKKRYGEISLLLSELDACVPAPETVEHIADMHALAGQIDVWLTQQSIEDRRLFLRRYWYGESVSAIAKSLGLTANTLTQKLFRMRRSLKGFLEREDILI